MAFRLESDSKAPLVAMGLDDGPNEVRDTCPLDDSAILPPSDQAT